MSKKCIKWLSFAGLMVSIVCLALPASADEAGEGVIFTFWPLIDYRESPSDGFSNLGILGPLIKIQSQGDEKVVAVRPLFYREEQAKYSTVTTDYLYPLASTDSTPEVSRFQFLKLVQKNAYQKENPESQERDSMFFPFYISGTSKKYGPYTSVFPIYGDIYERFWRDEYHFVLFPLYGRTVKKGTTSRNYLYPFFNTIEGEKESGFHFWPLYGQSAKEGVYQKRFVLWPFFMQEKSGIDTDNPTEKLILFPLYSSTDSPDKTARGYLWPFAGYTEDRKKKETEHDYLWPLIWTVRGEKRQVDSYLPFYSHVQRPESSRTWYLWPLFRHDTISSDQFSQERNRLLFFLYTDSLESWPKDGTSRRRTALWPLFVYKRDPRGVKSLGIPAPVEPVFDLEGIEKSWSPLWRLYQQKWNDSGDSAVSFLWNLYWHEVRGKSLAYELFPLVSYRGDEGRNDLSLLKGMIRYRTGPEGNIISLFWLPFGLSWGDPVPVVSTPVAQNVSRSTLP
jgi:hypothetical protein